jgi:SnoaL-like domain
VTDISTAATMDQLAIRALIDAYAHFADRRQPESQAALYQSDGITEVYAGDPSTSEPAQVLVGRDAHIEGFRSLAAYVATTHFNGQTSISLDGDLARAETYCLAHHLSEVEGRRTLMVMSIRYLDEFGRQNGQWRFSRRKLVIDWTDSRDSTP